MRGDACIVSVPATANPADRFAVGPGGFDRRAIEQVGGVKERRPSGLQSVGALPRRCGLDDAHIACALAPNIAPTACNAACARVRNPG
jgi:hypothetical protein